MYLSNVENTGLPYRGVCWRFEMVDGVSRGYLDADEHDQFKNSGCDFLNAKSRVVYHGFTSTSTPVSIFSIKQLATSLQNLYALISQARPSFAISQIFSIVTSDILRSIQRLLACWDDTPS